MVAAAVIPATLHFSKHNSAMNLTPKIFALVSLAVLAGCSTPDSRIADKRSAFDQYPAGVQQKIRAGQVDVGFTKEMVVLALGEPERRFTRKTEAGDTEVWGYHDHKPKFSFGLGIASGGYHSGVGGAVAVSSGGDDPEERTRVEFREGRVTAIDRLK